MRSHGPRDIERPLQIRVEHPIPILIRDVRDGDRGGVDARTVEDVVDAWCGGRDVGDGGDVRVARLGIAHIEGGDARGGTAAARRLAQRGGGGDGGQVEVREVEGGAQRSEFDGGGSADAAPGAGYEDAFSAEWGGHVLGAWDCRQMVSFGGFAVTVFRI